MKRLISALLAVIMLVLMVPVTSATVSAASPLRDLITDTAYTVGGTDYNLRRGYYYAFGGQMSNDRTPYYQVYYYSNGYFTGSSHTYDDHLATMSLNLAISAQQENRTAELKYTHCPTRQLMAEIGLEEDRIFVSDDELIKPTTDTVGFMIGQKKLKTKDGTETGDTLVVLAIRGENEGGEWVSDFMIGDKGEVQGYCAGATKVMTGLMAYLNKYGLYDQIKTQNNVKIWITGYSRGATIGEMVAKRLVDKVLTDRSETLASNQFDKNVYAYCWAPVMAGIDTDGSAKNYKCIHNINNYGDITNWLAPDCEGFEFCRYGVDHVFPSADKTEYAAQRKAFMWQYHLIDPHDAWDYEKHLDEAACDTFDLCYIKSGWGLGGSIYDIYKNKKFNPIDSKYPYSSNHYMGDYFALFVKLVQAWGIKDRDQYCNEPVVLNGNTYATVEAALRDVGSLLFAADKDQQKAALKLIKTINLDDIVEDVPTLLLWNSISESKKDKLIKKYWDKIVDTGCFGPEGLDLTDEQLESVRVAFPTAVCTLIPLIIEDIDNGLSSYCSKVNNLSVYSSGYSKYIGVISCTMINSVEDIVCNFDFEVYLAWARSFDSFYARHEDAKDDDWYYSASNTYTPKYSSDENFKTEYNTYFSNNYSNDGKIPAVTVPSSAGAAVTCIDGVELSAAAADPTLISVDAAGKITFDVPDVVGETMFYSITDAMNNSDVIVEYRLFDSSDMIPQDCAEDIPYKLTVEAVYNGAVKTETYYFKKTQLSEEQVFYIEGAVFKTDGYGDIVAAEDGKYLVQCYIAEETTKEDYTFSADSSDLVTVCVAVYDGEGRFAEVGFYTDYFANLCDPDSPPEVAVTYTEGYTYQVFLMNADLAPMSPVKDVAAIE